MALLASATLATAAAPTFEKDIRPILRTHCFGCHGEGNSSKGGLDLRQRRQMLQGGESGPALVPGHPEKSRLFQFLRDGTMPKRGARLPADQVERIRQWIATGARTARPEPETPPANGELTEEDRSFWSFQPVRKPEVPKARSRDRVRTPVDAFLLRPLAREGLGFGPEADRLSLIRRVTQDLTGLPPTPEETAAFLADTKTNAYERLVDRLLDSGRYGERWGRHWLDVAGYADSDGFSEADPPRAHAHAYRDYVIRSFNADLPFDRFISEQLAGDELARVTEATAPAAAQADPAARDRLIATGFLRMGADGTASSGVDPEVVRNQVVADTLKIVSTSLLGLSVGCAQCHDHRYDPIPQVDYYRLRAVFEPALDPAHWKTPDQRRISLQTAEDRKRATEIEAQAQAVSVEREAKQKQFLAEALAEHLKKFEPPLRERLKAAFDLPAEKRSAEQKALLADNPSVNISPGVLYQYNAKAAEELKALDAKAAEIRSRKPVEDFLAVLTEPGGTAPVTHLLHRGDPRQPRQAVGPGGLSVLSPAGSPAEFPAQDPALGTTGRRLALARWLTSGNHPLVARVLVNRVWMHHFGRGLVPTPADFGAMGERPTHPELLDWLATDFMEHGWKLKRLHRWILTSTAYRQSSGRSPKSDRRDPENRLYGRMPVQRLDAEAVRDSILAVSGSLNGKQFGPPVPVRPDVHGQIVVGEDRTEGDNRMPLEVALNGEEFRRSVYVQVRRSRPLALLHAFDSPVMEVNCERRQNSTVATQSLMLMNSAFVLDQAARFANRVIQESGADRARQVGRAWQLAFQREPRPAELRDALAFLESQTVRFSRATAEATPANPVPTERQALTDLCQTLLSANEFLYLD